MMNNLDAIAKAGKLRAAINTGNRALVHSDSRKLSGVSPALAQRLAQQLGVTLEPVMYSGAGNVFEDAEKDRWDVAFLAVDATRAKKVSFTRPYHVIDATYAVRSDSPIRDVADADRKDVGILTSTGSAYDMHLSANLKNAQLEHSGTPSESFYEFRAGRCDAVAGVRASLERHFEDAPEFRILPGVLTRVSQAMVLAGQDNPLIKALDDFVAQAIADGFVARELGEKTGS